MKKSLLLLTLAISIYDISYDPKRVIVEACSQLTDDCTRISVLKSDLDKPETIENLLLILRQAN